MRVEDSPCPRCGAGPGTLEITLRTWPAKHPMYLADGETSEPTLAPCLHCSECQLHARGEYVDGDRQIEFDVLGSVRMASYRKPPSHH